MSLIAFPVLILVCLSTLSASCALSFCCLNWTSSASVVFIVSLFSACIKCILLSYSHSEPWASAPFFSSFLLLSSSNSVQQNTYCFLMSPTAIIQQINFTDIKCDMPPALWALCSLAVLASISHSPSPYAVQYILPTHFPLSLTLSGVLCYFICFQTLVSTLLYLSPYCVGTRRDG